MIDFFSSIGSFIMTPLYYVVSAGLVGFHSLFGRMFGPESGASWVLSIIGLTVMIRAALIPLFVKQIKSSRNMQLIQPRVKELQKKYSHDREKLTQATMALYKETGTNPFASCLPILVQMPIFFALFRLIDHAADGQPKALLDATQAQQFGSAEFLGVPIAGTLLGSNGDLSIIFTAITLVLAMSATTFLTQRQLMSKNMPADALSGPYAQQQKLLLYVLPIVFAVGGLAFPIALMIYWTTSNIWTMCQQFYVIRNNPAPGTPAAKAKEERDRAKGKGGAAGSGETDGGTTTTLEGSDDELPPTHQENRPQQRQQPKKQTRSQRKKKGPKRPPST